MVVVDHNPLVPVPASNHIPRYAICTLLTKHNTSGNSLLSGTIAIGMNTILIFIKFLDLESGPLLEVGAYSRVHVGTY